MRLADQVQMAWRGVLAHPARSLLTMLGIGVGIAAVVLLTSIGQGVRGFVLGEFTQFGTNLLGVTPGRTSTFGMSAAVVHTTRPLSLEDADALAHLPRVVAVAAVVQGNADVEWRGRRRQTMVLGVGASAPELWRLRWPRGAFSTRTRPVRRVPRRCSVPSCAGSCSATARRSARWCASAASVIARSA